jgi:molybdopterin/thiamine biosynthesis adenylyltransferase
MPDVISLLLLAGITFAILLYFHMLGRMRRAAKDRQEETLENGPKDALSDTELDRYARHIVMREVGGVGQKRLRSARVLVVGAGGLGSPVLLYLAAAGVGTIGVIDDDEVSLSNLQRQVLYDEDHLNMPKVFAAQARLKALNPFVTVLPYHRRLTEEIAADLVADFDLVVDGTDMFAARQMINTACVAARVPMVWGAISQWEGQVSVFDPSKGAPCFHCIFPKAPADGQAPTCAEAGVIGALPGVVGSMMAAEAIKLITRAGTPLRGQMLIYDALESQNRKIKIKKDAYCAVCGD